MRVIGFGLRPHATYRALEQVFARVMEAAARLHDGAPLRPDSIATLDRRADSPALHALAKEHALPVAAVCATQIAGMETPTNSLRIQALFSTGSIAEATALLAAGKGARITVRRIVSTDGTASAALAETQGAIAT